MIAGGRFPQTMCTVRSFRTVVLLRIVAGTGEKMIEQAGNEFVGDDCLDRWPTNIKLASRMARGEMNRFGSDFRLKNRWDRLRFAREPAFHPTELRRVQRWQLHHRHAHFTLLMQKFAPQRVGKSSH